MGAQANEVPTLGEDSAYTLTKVDEKGENTVTKFEYNSETGEMTPVYYRLDLKKTEYGEGTESKTFDVNLINGGTAEITAKYNKEGEIWATDRITTNQNGADINLSFKELSSSNGGAIYNDYGSIGDITGDFIGNYASGNNAYGGAIYNYNGTIGDITGDFIGNYASGSRDSQGGAIYNYNGTIGDITGDFIGNYASDSNQAYGGAIYNYAYGTSTVTIGDITGDFIGNYASSSSSNAYGGAIYNYAYDSSTVTIGNITGDFIGNYASDSSQAYGGAIYNWDGTIGDITGNFIGNYASGNYAYGGAIYNDYGIIGNITGDFIGNYASSTSASGGAIRNSGTIDNITGDFIGNYAKSSSGEASGGAIYNNGKIGNIKGDFIGNYAPMYGGAIANTGYDTIDYYQDFSIGNITGSFIGNDATYGGAIYNLNQSINISGSNFVNNTSDQGGAIMTESAYYKGLVTPVFDSTVNIKDTLFESNQAYWRGGAIYITKDVTREAPGPRSLSLDEASISPYEAMPEPEPESYTQDMLIENSIFRNNSAETGGAISSQSTFNNTNQPESLSDGIATIATMAEDFTIINYPTVIVDDDGNVIETLPWYDIQQNNWDVEPIGINSDPVHVVIKNSLFENNTAESEYNAYGGAVSIETSSSIKQGVSDVTIGYEEDPYYITVSEIEADGMTLEEYIAQNKQWLEEDIASGNSFASKEDAEAALKVYYVSEDVSKRQDAFEFVNTSFINNKAIAAYGEAKGGAIYSQSNIKISADNGQSIFSGNKVVNSNEEMIAPGSLDSETPVIEDSEAIYLDNINYDDSKIRLTLETKNKGLIRFDDKINGNTEYDMNIQGDGTGKVVFNNQVINANITTFDGSFTHLTKESWWDGNNLTLNGGTLSMVNDSVGIAAMNNLTVTGDTNFIADVDLKTKTMDRISAKNYGKHTGNLNVSGMNLLSDAKSDKTEIYFAENGLKDNVTTTVSEVAYTPIYKYSVKYDNRNDGGYFVFNRGTNGGGSNGGNPSEAFNPSVLSAPIAGVAASQATVNETFKYVFEHADAFTQMPAHVRQARINANKYAISTDFNDNIGAMYKNNKAGWFRPYATFETMDLNNGPKVHATTYGSLAGFDTDFFEHKNGWHSVGTGYVGYNGSQLRYKGIDTTMNGGILGYTHTMYKGNFWSALTLSAGASVGQSNTMYGKEDFTSLLAGVGSKTGYNFEFKEGKYILQPVMFLSYTFVNTFDYTNAAGVKINADPAHSIQLNPSVRFIANTKNGWQPYASVGMVWNVMNENKVTANEVRLPEMGMKPYVEYGVGIQKNWKDRFTAFGQAMLRNGGRTGIALTGGFRWAIGREGKPIDKVQGVNDKKISLQSTTSGKHNEESLTSSRKILKQLTPQQKMALTGKKNTTITVNNGILKQL